MRPTAPRFGPLLLLRWRLRAGAPPLPAPAFALSIHPQRRWLPFLALLFTQALVAHGAPTFSACTLRTPGTPLEVEAQCASLDVAENPDVPDARQIALRIARVEAGRPGQRRPDPLYFLAGGPGQAATEAWPLLALALSDITRYRDVILVDQRGTGGSNRLDCPQDTSDASPLTSFDAEVAAREARRCLEQLDGDPRFYTTALAADDLERVRQALGHGAVNLLGVSYGTRLAQVFLRRHPESVRRVVLDGVVPPQLVLGTEHAPSLDRALREVFDRCGREPACEERFADPGATLRALRLALSEARPALTLPLPRSGERQTLEVTPELLAMSLRMLSYAGETQALIPLVIDRAGAGDWHPLVAQALLLVESLETQIAHGMELSVICSEDLPFYPSDLEQGDTLLGNLVVDALRAQCAEWPVTAVPAAFHEPQTHRMPVLLLSGEADPVTPPAYGALALEQYPAGAHWVVPGRAHGVLRHGCLARLVADFLDGADPASQDRACLERVSPSAFFVDMTGPMP